MSYFWGIFKPKTMKKLLQLLALTAIQFTNAQAPTAIWQKCYGGSNDDYINTLTIPSSDGGILLGLVTLSNDGDISGNHGNEDISLMKINATGILQWQKCYGGTGTESIHNLISTTDGGYIIIGTTRSSNDGDVSGNHGANDAWIIKINAIGIIQWQKCFGGSADDEFNTIIQTSDGGFIASGGTYSINNGDVLGNSVGGAWLVKISDLGVIQWQKIYETADGIRSFIHTSDGGYVLAGLTGLTSFPGYHGSGDIWIAKINQGGTIQWQKCYGGSRYDESPNIISTDDGGYMFSSYSDSNDGDVYGNHGEGDSWVVKLDSSGTILGQNCYGGTGNDGGGFVQKTLDGGYLLMTTAGSNDGNILGNHGGSDAWVVKFSATGAMQWQKCFGGTNDDYGGVFQLADGTYMAFGNTFSNDGDISGNHGATTSDAFLIKLTAANLVTENFVNKDIKYYPNPMQNILHIDIEKDFFGKIKDLTGKTLMNINTKDIDVSSLSAGIYLLDIVSEEKHYISKIIKE